MKSSIQAIIFMAIISILFLSIGSYSQSLSGKYTDNIVNPGVNAQDNMPINQIRPINQIYKLLSFTVSSSNIGDRWTTNLTWTAVGETQISGYEIERMMSTNPGIWTLISIVPGSNSNTLITRNYLETFTLTRSLTVFYRLKINFVNGSVQYSQVVHVTI